ncbi:ATP-binding cassette, subfamily B [Streptomyces indicus]|uniref:ATP-binding cassette, subfamily B n=1 Tax=Streptomyces indicus TaxID=417292 RepID=A0A1G9FL85_9ACTN|nr:ATP-binding cassette, subfamily B [Streptomyces indicus]
MRLGWGARNTHSGKGADTARKASSGDATTDPERPAAESGQQTPDAEQRTTDSEQLLFGGPLRYDTGWAQHEEAVLQLDFIALLRRFPALIAASLRLAWGADRQAARIVVGAELGRGIAQAVSLLAVNSVLTRLMTSAPIEQRLSAAAPALVTVACVLFVSALLRAASTYATGRLEPKVERVATEQYLERAASVELAAIEDDAFHKLLDTAQYGAASARRMVSLATRVVNAAISLIAAAGVLTVLHPLLLPLLVTMTLPSAWAALTNARRRYRSFHAWVQHARAGRLLSSLLTETRAAPEIRVHGVGPFLLRHFRAMSQSAEVEQTRLARLAARTSLVAAAWTGIATAATYTTLGALLLTGAMSLAVAGTAVIAIRTGSASLNTLVLEVSELHENALFVGDLERMHAEAATRTVPVGGTQLPVDTREIRFEKVTFRYPGSDRKRPALDDVSLALPTGKIIALVGENGSGKTTLVKLLAGLYAPQQGAVLWDGVDAAGADRAQLAERIAMVAQDFKRWPFTAKVNIAIGRASAAMTEERLTRSVADAGAEDVVTDLPRGLETLLVRAFTGGHELSGGQWQRLGIARAAYRRGSILIVDEPTAALDARAELEVFDRIRALAGTGQTVILITHRLASVRHADLVHVLEAGRLVESGTPQELLDRGGVYAELYSLQARQFADGVVPGS